MVRYIAFRVFKYKKSSQRKPEHYLVAIMVALWDRMLERSIPLLHRGMGYFPQRILRIRLPLSLFQFNFCTHNWFCWREKLCQISCFEFKVLQNGTACFNISRSIVLISSQYHSCNSFWKLNCDTSIRVFQINCAT